MNEPTTIFIGREARDKLSQSPELILRQRLGGEQIQSALR